VFKKDFSKESTVSDMNAWANKKSDGLINKPFQELSEQDKIVLINLLNFKGKWISEFDKEKTKEDNFYLKDNIAVKVDMMNKEGMMSYYEDYEVKSGILNYYNGRMILLLPNGNIDEYINNLSIEKIKSYTENTSNSIVKLKLPKLSLEYKEDISPVLKQMGINYAFNSAQASFKMLHEDTEPLWIGSVLHDCVIKVDEEGTSGAALTAVNLCGAAPPKGTYELYINKPFLFIIQDNSGTSLFIGKVDNAIGK
jgi:serine protease inhibitor